MPSFNGFPIIAMPSTPAPRSIEFNPADIVGFATSPFTGQQQVQNWQNAFMRGSIVLPSMTRQAALPWIAFLLALNGAANLFQLGDPSRKALAGVGGGSPEVNGASQTGFTLSVKGLPASTSGVWLAGDQIQIGYRLYNITAAVNADGSGNAIAQIWPNLRESPADSAAIVTANTQGIWRLDAAADRRWSVSPGALMPSIQFTFREAI